MKRFALSLVAAALLTAGAAHAQTYALTKSQQNKLTTFAPKGPTWPSDKNGNPIPNSHHQCPPGYRYFTSTFPTFGPSPITIELCVRG